MIQFKKYNFRMEQSSNAKWYFVFGSPEKSSLCSHFCRQNDYIHYCQPKAQQLKPTLNKNAIIEGSVDLFRQIEKIKPNLQILLVGKPLNNDEKHLCSQYQKIGKYHQFPTYNYEQFRKKLFCKLIFIYGPVQKQNQAIARSLAQNIGYLTLQFNKDHNYYISHLNKAENYVVNGLFQDINQIRIMSQYFEIRVIHLKYNRVDLSASSNYFDKEFNLVNYLKNKSFYIQAPGKEKEQKILSQIGEKLCPKLIYVNLKNSNQQKYVAEYIEQSSGLLLNLNQIQAINKRKNLPQADTTQSKIHLLSSIFYKDLNRKEIVLSEYPWALNQILLLEKLNRKISIFIDLSQNKKYQYSKQYSTPMYFQQNQRLITPNIKNLLKQQLEPKVTYWLIVGAAGSGKTSVSKFLSNQFSYKLIEFQPYISSIKQKLITPEEGEEVPPKKIIDHFKHLLFSDPDSTYIIDGLPFANKDLQNWVRAIGNPNVISLQVQQNEQIKRLRRKAQGDLAAEITEQESNKSKQSTEKSRQWIEKLRQLNSTIKIHSVDYNRPQILIQDEIRKLMKPRIFLIQRNNTLIYQNIALKYDLGYINLTKIRLRECANLIKKTGKTDIILCNHGHEKTRMASEDLYWAEKNLGQIRYLGIWQNESKQKAQQVLKLERPLEPQKPKASEGQQKPPQDPPADGEQGKKKMDIYDYEWTEPGSYRNLTQWFFKSKQHITQFQSTAEQCYNKFGRVIDKLNENAQNNVYEKVK